MYKKTKDAPLIAEAVRLHCLLFVGASTHLSVHPRQHQNTITMLREARFLTFYIY